MAQSTRKTSLDTVYRYVKYLEDLSTRRIPFDDDRKAKALGKDPYQASIKKMKKIFKGMQHVRRNLRDRARESYMHALDPYLRNAHYSPRILRLLAKTAKEATSKERDSNHEQKEAKQANEDKSNKVSQPSLLKPHKK